MTILVSACLLGVPCRYDGQSRAHPLARALCKKHHVVPVCGEIFGGLPTPRSPAERQPDGRVVNRAGEDVTDAYLEGAGRTLALALEAGCTLAVLKAKSPSFGCHEIYDGSFTGRLVPGQGVAARLLEESGIRVVDETELDSLL